MPPAPAPHAVAHALRARAGRIRRRVGEARATRHTVNRPFFAAPAPSADRFATWDGPATLAPPADVPHPGRVRVGRDVLLLEGSAIHVYRDDAVVELGDRVLLARYARIDCTVGIRLGAGVMSSDFIALVDHVGDPDGPLPLADAAPIEIGDGAYLGYGSIVGPGVTVGPGSFVGEGSVVVEDVPAHSVVYGNPATVIRSLEAGRWAGARFP